MVKPIFLYKKFFLRVIYMIYRNQKFLIFITSKNKIQFISHKQTEEYVKINDRLRK